jgi:hypothetical protein
MMPVEGIFVYLKQQECGSMLTSYITVSCIFGMIDTWYMLE